MVVLLLITQLLNGQRLIFGEINYVIWSAIDVFSVSFLSLFFEGYNQSCTAPVRQYYLPILE